MRCFVSFCGCRGFIIQGPRFCWFAAFVGPTGLGGGGGGAERFEGRRWGARAPARVQNPEKATPLLACVHCFAGSLTLI